MSYRVTLQWGFAIEMTSSGLATLSNSNLLFNQRGGKRFLRSIGGRIRTSYAPVVLEPTDVFYATLKKLQTTLNFSGKKLPYDLESLRTDMPGRLNINFHLFGKLLFLNFILSEFEIAGGCDFSELQKVENYPDLEKLFRYVLAIASTYDHRAEPLGNLPRYYPAIRIVSLEDDPADWRRRMAVLVSRHPLMLDRVADTVLEKNDPHQVDQSLLLIDKQGVVAYVPAYASAAAAGNLQRFANAIAMLEFAVMLQFQLKKRVALPEDALRLITSPHAAIADSVSAQKAWELVNAEFKLVNELEHAPQKGPEMASQRLLIVTVTSVESRAVLSAFATKTGQLARNHKVDKHVYKQLGVVAGFECFLATSDMGSGGASGSQMSIQKAISEIKPETVIMVGIAFGIDDTQYAIGDILVAKQLQMYDLQRVSKDGNITLRGDKASASSAPLNWLRNAEMTWPEDSGKVKAGLMLSGDKLIDNLNYRTALTTLAPEALGGEMEGAGLYVACQEARVDWLLIKAICDWADGDKGDNKTVNQQIAATAAANFVVHMLSSTA
ncbi:5'-methylthioadenosine/S-adenosylhomocysteine nucleosidase family protein [Pseudomonas sp. 1152_12]|uniref:5'-methylthioadenosine/S-adenosylhomocysteine nucleosidase family protein n=1 Tax=Pseudomonas sp. 1152_12 TaxID=2604455 RepID=UPI004062A28F